MSGTVESKYDGERAVDEAADELIEAVSRLFFPGPDNAAARQRVREIVREHEQDRGKGGG